MCTIAYGNRRGSSWKAREKYTFRGVHDADWQKEPHPDKEATKAEETDIFVGI